MPYDLERDRPFAFWETLFTLMDTTLASFMRLTAVQALAELDAILDARGAAGLIWHQEQCGDLLDPGYHRLYADILEHLAAAGVQAATGTALVDGMQRQWDATETA